MSEITKVIFLDVDGVINGLRVIYSLPKGEERGYNAFDPISIALIRKVLELTGAKIVVSSTWRKDPDVLQKLQLGGFSRYDFHPHYRTASLGGFRGDEVAAWLKDHPEITHYVCIDDDSDFHPHQPLVLTDGINGVSLQHFDEMLQHLGAPEHGFSAVK